jgi:hypothetical protein
LEGDRALSLLRATSASGELGVPPDWTGGAARPSIACVLTLIELQRDLSWKFQGNECQSA